MTIKETMLDLEKIREILIEKIKIIDKKRMEKIEILKQENQKEALKKLVNFKSLALEEVEKIFFTDEQKENFKKFPVNEKILGWIEASFEEVLSEKYLNEKEFYDIEFLITNLSNAIISCKEDFYEICDKYNETKLFKESYFKSIGPTETLSNLLKCFEFEWGFLDNQIDNEYDEKLNYYLKRFSKCIELGCITKEEMVAAIERIFIFLDNGLAYYLTEDDVPSYLLNVIEGVFEEDDIPEEYHNNLEKSNKKPAF